MQVLERLREGFDWRRGLEVPILLWWVLLGRRRGLEVALLRGWDGVRFGVFVHG